MKKFTSEVAGEIRSWLEGSEVKAALANIKGGAEADTGTFRVVITTENLDRYQEIIKLDGWDVTNYLNNPVVLWGHDHQQLIGMATSLSIVNGQMVAEGRFAPTAQGQEMRQLYEAGFLKATSVGFMIKEQEGNVITQAELLEFSFVSVPANPYALALAMEKELDINDLVRRGFMEIKQGETVDTIPEEKEKGAVADELDAEAACELKWENYSQVADILYAFYDVYFDEASKVEDFQTLLDETIGLLQQVGTGKKGLKPSSDMRAVLETYGTLKALSKENLKALFIALEAPVAGEPERKEEEEAAVDPEEEKSLKEFQLKRGVQVAATVLGEVLAEWRQKNEEEARH